MNMRTKRKNNKSRKGMMETLIYTGPVVMPTGPSDLRITSISIPNAVDAITDSGGVLKGDFSTTGVSSLTEWTDLIDLYQEYRVVAMRLQWQNLYVNTTSGITPALGAVAAYHSAYRTYTSINTLIQNTDHKLFNTAMPVTIDWKARGADEMQWLPCQVNSDLGSLSYYADEGQPTTRLGRWYITWTVQFRGRK